MDKKNEIQFNQGKKRLEAANQELYKPKEDVVTYLVCKNSQNAIESYLRGYLNHKGITLTENESLEKLLSRCKLIDPTFNKIDLSDVSCKGHEIDSRYCSEVEKVSSCFEAANSLDTLLKQMKIL